MATSSGSLSDDDGGQQFDNLNNSIRENSEKLAAVTKLLAGGDDTPNAQKMRSQSKKVLSAENAKFAKDFSLKQQAQLDKLSSNNFRATETIISELLSRFGGTSFYPALSAFRVARESVAVGTGKTQSELDVMDIIKFVNDSSKELLNNMFSSFGQSIGLVKKPIEDLNASLQETAEAAAKAAEEAAKTIDTKSIQEETMPTLTEYGKAFTKVSLPGGIEKATIDELNKALILIKTTDELATNFADVAEKIKDALVELGEPEVPFSIANKKEREKFKATTAKEMEAFDAAKSAAISEKVGSELSPEAMKAAKTAAGIAGLGVSALTLMSDFKELGKVAIQTGTALKDTLAGAALTPQGITSGTSSLSAVSAAAGGLPELGSIIGTGIGTFFAGPAGGLIGSVIGSVIGSTVGLPIQAAVTILTSIEQGISQIADDLVGFSPDLTLASIERDLALLGDDQRRANQIGDEIARLTGAQTNLQLASRRAFDSLVEVTEPLLTTIANTLSILLNQFASTKAFLEGALTGLGAVFGVDLIALLKGISAGVNVIADMMNPPDPDLGDLNSIVNVKPDANWFARNNLIKPTF